MRPLDHHGNGMDEVVGEAASNAGTGKRFRRKNRLLRPAHCLLNLDIIRGSTQTPMAKLQKRWIAILLAIAALIAVACGGSATATPPPTATSTPVPAATPGPTPDAGDLVAIDPDELQRYLDAVGPAFQRALLDRRAVDRELTAPGPSSQAKAVAAWFERVSDNRQRLVDAVKAIDPPVGLTSIHDEFVLATSGWVALADQVVDLLADAGPEFIVGRDLVNHPELGVAPANRLSNSANASCAIIERLAVDNGIDVDLGCDVIFN